MESGRIIAGKYRLHTQIGEGGMGKVWSAVHEALGRTVAIKFLAASGSDQETASARFVGEARIAARVKHRFVVDVFDFGVTDEGVPYMVQELLEGQELAHTFDRGPAWAVREAVQFMAHCLDGLEAVHQAGIVHRDLKPENIFVVRDSDGRVPKLLDFGISKASGTSAEPQVPAKKASGRRKQLTSAGLVLGTPWYMSPEQLRGCQDLDGRSDIYSIGVILYEWLTGRVPYACENPVELSSRIAAGNAIPLKVLRPELGSELSDVLMRALAPSAGDRFESAADMRVALRDLASTLPSEALSCYQSSAEGEESGEKAAIPQMGMHTQLLLASAANPFGDREKRSFSGAGYAAIRSRPWLTAGTVALIVLACAPFLLSSNVERAGAAASKPEPMLDPASAAQHAVPAIAPLAIHTTQPERASAKAASPAETSARSTDEGATVADEPAPEPSSDERKRSRSARSRTRGTRSTDGDAKPSSSSRKVIHKLDF